MKSASERWGIVLAGGAGIRLQDLTTDARGLATPKQYCTLEGGRSLLGDALARVGRLIPPERTLVIVASEHHRWWQHELRELPRENVVVQPANRGTAAGILLPTLLVLERDPDARIVVVPSDHFVEKEHVLEMSMRFAMDSLWGLGGGVILLGIRPEAPETDYGWIVPARCSLRTKPIEAFVEKPRPERALELLKRGGLWNSLLLVADGQSLLWLFRRHAPELLDEFQRALASPAKRPRALEDLYACLEDVDFSRHVLEREEHLLTIEVPACGWTDLGTPARVMACLRRRLGTPTHALLGRREDATDGGRVHCLARAVRSSSLKPEPWKS